MTTRWDKIKLSDGARLGWNHRSSRQLSTHLNKRRAPLGSFTSSKGNQSDAAAHRDRRGLLRELSLLGTSTPDSVSTWDCPLPMFPEILFSAVNFWLLDLVSSCPTGVILESISAFLCPE
jgi:hypothetical protein